MKPVFPILGSIFTHNMVSVLIFLSINFLQSMFVWETLLRGQVVHLPTEFKNARIAKHLGWEQLEIVTVCVGR